MIPKRIARIVALIGSGIAILGGIIMISLKGEPIPNYEMNWIFVWGPKIGWAFLALGVLLSILVYIDWKREPPAKVLNLDDYRKRKK